MPADFAASVQGVSIRVTRLDANGNLLTGAMDSYTTSSFIRTSFTPEYEDGDEITEKAADGTVCVSFKAPDTLKRVTMEIAICDPDPEITGLLSGGLLLSGINAQGNEVSLGWASAQTGEDPSGNGVSVEVWSRAIQNGKPAGTNPYYHWVFPYVKTRLSGDRVIENGLMATTFEGFGLGNINFRSGPDGSWEWPASADRPYAYARRPWAPTGLRGFYRWTPGVPGVPGSGTPGTGGYIPPTPQSPPISGAASASLIDNVKAGFNVDNGGVIYPKDSSLEPNSILSAADYLPDGSGTVAYPAAATATTVRNVSPTGQPPVTYKVREGGGVTPYSTATPATAMPTMPTPPGLVTVAWPTGLTPTVRADLVRVTMPSGTPAFTPGNYIVVNGERFNWDGASWAKGGAPDQGTTARGGYSRPVRTAAQVGDTFTTSDYATITASDATNAAKLGTGNIRLTALPTTAWTSGQKLTIKAAGTSTGYDFYWNGTAWAAGAAA